VGLQSKDISELHLVELGNTEDIEKNQSRTSAARGIEQTSGRQ